MPRYTYETYPGQTIIRDRRAGFTATQLQIELAANGEGVIVLHEEADRNDQVLLGLEGRLVSELVGEPGSFVYWQAEIYKNGEVYDLDFPRRTTADEALEDARERMSSFTTSEAKSMSGGAAEWISDEGQAVSTGKHREL